MSALYQSLDTRHAFSAQFQVGESEFLKGVLAHFAGDHG